MSSDVLNSTTDKRIVDLVDQLLVDLLLDDTRAGAAERSNAIQHDAEIADLVMPVGDPEPGHSDIARRLRQRGGRGGQCHDRAESK